MSLKRRMDVEKEACERTNFMCISPIVASVKLGGVRVSWVYQRLEDVVLNTPRIEKHEMMPETSPQLNLPG